MSGQDAVEAILDLARWAPSGDNEQPWRFERVAPLQVLVHGYDTRDTCVYDLDGTASQIALGALVETMAIAASLYGMRAEILRRPDAPDVAPLIDVVFEPDSGIGPDPLAAFIRTRSVNRRALSTRTLAEADKRAFAEAVSDRFELHWREGWHGRAEMARLLFVSAKLRLTMPEAYRVHRDAIEWGARFSDDRVPERAVGLDPVTARLMRWVMRSWPRVRFFNRFLGGTYVPRLQLDFLPAIACAGHFFLVARKPLVDIDDFIAAGRAVQRMWLTATRLSLQLQPEVTPLIFARYSRESRRFSETAGMADGARRLDERLVDMLGNEFARQAVFMGRVGAGAAANARSLRRPLAELMLTPSPDSAAPQLQKFRRTST